MKTTQKNSIKSKYHQSHYNNLSQPKIPQTDRKLKRQQKPLKNRLTRQNIKKGSNLRFKFFFSWLKMLPNVLLLARIFETNSLKELKLKTKKPL